MRYRQLFSSQRIALPKIALPHGRVLSRKKDSCHCRRLFRRVSNRAARKYLARAGAFPRPQREGAYHGLRARLELRPAEILHRFVSRKRSNSPPAARYGELTGPDHVKKRIIVNRNDKPWCKVARCSAFVARSRSCEPSPLAWPRLR
jgi:hypothetical protein